MQQKKIKLPKVPRPMAEITKEQYQLLLESGQLAFAQSLNKKRQDEVYARLIAIDGEAQARKSLDETEAKLKGTQDETKRD